MNMKQTALILIDIQKENNFQILNSEEVVKKADELVGISRELKIPIIFTRHINRADGIGLSKGEPLSKDNRPIYYCSDSANIQIADGINVANEDIIIDKYRWSAFYGTSLDLILKSMDIKHLLIGGLVTDGCLMTSVLDAYFHDYDIHLIHDICSTTSEGAHMSSLLIMANWTYNIKIYTTKNIIKRLTGQPYDMWRSEEPDSLNFTPENLREKFYLISKGGL